MINHPQVTISRELWPLKVLSLIYLCMPRKQKEYPATNFTLMEFSVFHTKFRFGFKANIYKHLRSQVLLKDVVLPSLSVQTPMHSVTVKHMPKFTFIANLPDATGNISMLKNNYLLKQLSLLQPQCSMAVLLFHNFRKTWKLKAVAECCMYHIIPFRKF